MTRAARQANCSICDRAPATERCERCWDSLSIGLICRACHASKRVSYPCRCMSLEEAQRIVDDNIKAGRYAQQLPMSVSKP